MVLVIIVFLRHIFTLKIKDYREEMLDKKYLVCILGSRIQVYICLKVVIIFKF